ncbi:solute carrier family 35 member E4 isoform X1 [Silurus meridionalis]|uniref:solute carrier family 35 member E4 isoform X1 n=1 Tax=Silurus meridionalis TaxID=175797 RepID=UPI001EEBBFC2|nr:solute carrier family 35 member E4 isoform X1 [Silurus meridionalis]
MYYNSTDTMVAEDESNMISSDDGPSKSEETQDNRQRSTRPVETLHLLSAVVVWLVTGTTISSLNKWIFAVYNFRYPLLLSALHMLTAIIFGVIKYWFDRSQGVARQELTSSAKCKVFLLSLTFCASIAFGNVGLNYVQLSFAQMIYTTTPIFTLAISSLVLGKQHHILKYTAMMPICLGASFSIMGEVQFDRTGCLFVLAATMLRGIKSIQQSILLQEEKINSVFLLYLMAIPSFCILSVAALFLENWSALQSPHHYDRHLWGFIVLSCLGSVLYNLSSCFVISLTSAVTLHILGNLNMVGNLLLSQLLFGNQLSALSCAGAVLTLSGMIIYQNSEFLITYMDTRRKKEAETCSRCTYENTYESLSLYSSQDPSLELELCPSTEPSLEMYDDSEPWEELYSDLEPPPAPEHDLKTSPKLYHDLQAPLKPNHVQEALDQDLEPYLELCHDPHLSADPPAALDHDLKPSSEIDQNPGLSSELNHDLELFLKLEHELEPSLELGNHVVPLPESDHELEPFLELVHHLEPSSELEHELEPSLELVHHLKPSSEPDHELEPSLELVRHAEPSSKPDHVLEPSSELVCHARPSSELDLAVNPSSELEHNLEPSSEPMHDLQPCLEPVQEPSSLFHHDQEPSSELDHGFYPLPALDNDLEPSSLQEHDLKPSLEQGHAYDLVHDLQSSERFDESKLRQESLLGSYSDVEPSAERELFPKVAPKSDSRTEMRFHKKMD